MLLHVDTAAGVTVPAGATVLEALRRIAVAQRELVRPEAAGGQIDGQRVRAA
jgi:hypothetical protein